MKTSKSEKTTFTRRKKTINKAYSSLLSNSKENQCKYQIPKERHEAGYNCEFEIGSFDDEPFCIFHRRKFTTEEKKSFTVDEEIVEHNVEIKFSEGIETILANSANTEHIDFRGFIFPESTYFKHPFPVKASFDNAVFMGDIDFSVEFENPKPEHEYDTESRLLLINGGSFKNSLFNGKAIFEACEFKQDINFESAIFEKDAIFSGISCSGEANFNNADFKGNALFSHATFKNVAFRASKFAEETEFVGFEVELTASFDSAIFDRYLEFAGSRFGTLCISYDDEGNKIEIEDTGLTSFYRAIFNEKAAFYDTTFECEVDFDSATFKKQVEFVPYKMEVFQNGGSFRGITLPKDDDFIFEKVNLGKMRFHDTNLEKIIFRDVRWATERNKLQRFFRGDSYILWDEIRPSEGMNDYHDESKTAENYRQLVINYESKRDYESAEYFHIGEMEMRRRRVGDRINYENYRAPSKLTLFLTSRLRIYYLSSYWYQARKYLNGHGLYWLSSRYGTSYTQAVIVLIFLISIFSTLFMFAGIKTSKEVNTDTPQIIEYNLLPDSHHIPTSPKKIYNDYKEAISYTLSIITFQKDRFYEPLDSEARYLLYLAVFVLTAQSALILLAIRRQFRR